MQEKVRTVVLVRCQHCMHERTRYNDPEAIVFIAATLKNCAEMKCEHCGETGMEIYVGEAPRKVLKTHPKSWYDWDVAYGFSTD